MHLAGRLRYGGSIDIGDRYACSLAGEEPAHRPAVADRWMLDFVALLAGADNEDLAPREAFAAASDAASLGRRRLSKGGHLGPFWLR
jgi:hypothetical protein